MIQTLRRFAESRFDVPSPVFREGERRTVRRTARRAERERANAVEECRRRQSLAPAYSGNQLE